MSQKTCPRKTLYSLVGWGIGEDDGAGNPQGSTLALGIFFICAPSDRSPFAAALPASLESSGMCCSPVWRPCSRNHWRMMR